jgi:hypothetical protein
MRNLGLIILVCSLSFVACKKKYTCTCFTLPGGKWVDMEIEKGGKKAAEKECKSYNNDPALDGSIDCHLK